MKTENRTIILLAALIAVTGMVSSNNGGDVVYFIDAYVYQNDTTVLNNITSGYGVESDFPTMETGYFIEIRSKDERVLFRKNLGVSFMLNFEKKSEDELPVAVDMERDKVLVFERLPYSPDAFRILILHKDKVILDIDLSKELCNNNGMCNLGENKPNCPKDCGEYVTTIPIQTTTTIKTTTTIRTTTTIKTTTTILATTTTISKPAQQTGYLNYLISLILAILIIIIIYRKFVKKD